MSLPPALMQRLAQRGLVHKRNERGSREDRGGVAESEEVIAEDYDEMDSDEPLSQEDPSQYELQTDTKKRTEENFWLERMKARMGDAGTAAGYKGCPNKYNIWHKCTLYCVNRWAEGRPEPSRDYLRRFKRLMRKYPLPKGWAEMYDPGCACFYFCSRADQLVSWLPPTHPKSQVSKCAAAYRRQMEEASGDGGSNGEAPSDDDQDVEESSEARHQREIDEIISSTLRARSPATLAAAAQDSAADAVESGPANSSSASLRKPKSRDLERSLARPRREGDRERERDRGHGRRRGRDEAGVLDPMDPSAYSDAPRGKWSDGLHTGGDERKKGAGGASAAGAEDSAKERNGANVSNGRDRHVDSSDDDEDDDDDDEESYL